MNAHKNLSRLDVLRHGPKKIAAMAASEFYRAAQRVNQPESVRLCLLRGRELLGILETQPLPPKSVQRLKPIFYSASSMHTPLHAKPEHLSRRMSEIAFELEQSVA